MAKYTNVSGAKLVVTDELGLFVSFEIGETKGGLSNYLENWTSSVISDSEDIMLVRVGSLDGDGTIPVAGIEEENIAVHPSAPNRATQGISVSGKVGGVKAADTAVGYNDLANNAERLDRIVLDTNADIAKRQIDTRHVGLKPAKEIAFNTSQTFAAGALSQGAGTDERAFTLSNLPAEFNGRIATAADDANVSFGALINESQGYTAYGVVTVVDNSTSAIINSAFAVTGTTVTIADPTFGGALTGMTGSFVTATGVLTWTRIGGQITDTVATTINYARGVIDGATADASYNVSDEVRGVYEVKVETAGTGNSALLTLTDAGIHEQIDGAAVNFVPWS